MFVILILQIDELITVGLMFENVSNRNKSSEAQKMSVERVTGVYLLVRGM